MNDKMIEYNYGNPVDLVLLKRNVLRNYLSQVDFWKKKADSLYPFSQPRQTCILCGSRKYEVVGHVHGWPWHRCKECTHAYNGRILSPEKYLEFYQITDEPINYSDTYTDPEVQDYRCNVICKSKINYITKYCGGKKGRWLDIAAGNGDLVYLAKTQGYDAMGVDISPASVKFAKEKHGVDLYLGTIEDFAKERKEKWDILSFMGITDLIVNPVEYIQIAASLLKKNGIMAIDFPNFDSFSTKVQMTYNDQIICRHIYPSVLSSYTEKSATTIIKKEGFSIVSV